MRTVTVKPGRANDWEIVRKIAASEGWERPKLDTVVKAAQLTGRLLLIATADDEPESVVGFALTRIIYPTVWVDWLVAYRVFREPIVQALVKTLRERFDKLDILVRVPSNERQTDRQVLEFLATLRDVVGIEDMPGGLKGKDEDAVPRYVRLAGAIDSPSNRSGPRKEAVVEDLGSGT